MVTVICEKTGIEFEAATKRTKNHPKIMSILTEANKDGWYGDAMESLKEGRATGLATIEEFVTLLEQTKEAHDNQRMAAFRTRRDEQEKQKDARRERAYTNSILSSHGYKWVDLGYADDEEVDNSYTGPTPSHDWQLFTSDDKAVSTVQAMREIASQGSQNAKNWLAERNIPMIEETTDNEETAQSEQKTYEQEKQEAQEVRRQQELAERGITADTVHESVKNSDPTKLNEQLFYWLFAGQEDN